MLVCKNGEQREILKNVQVENAVEVEVIRVVRLAQTMLLLLDGAHSQITVRLEFDNSQRREREGDSGFQ